jgi:hypothetical protein
VDFAVKYQSARERILIELQPLQWVSWRILHRICNRYSARVLDLKRLGYKIEDEPDPSGHGKRYRLINPVPSRPQGKQVKLYLPEPDAEALVRGDVTLFTVAAASTALRIFRANKHKL